jgi:hypothetical protein
VPSRASVSFEKPGRSQGIRKSKLLYCPNCNALIGADDINIKALVAKCAGCAHVFPLPMNNVVAAGIVEDEPAPARPNGIVEETGPNGELYIKRRWFSFGLFFLLFFCIFWDGFLVFWYAMAFAGWNNGGGAFMWLPILFPLLHVAVGIGLTYTVIAGFFNTTRILVDQEMLFLRHGPLPWWANRDLPTAEITAFQVDWSFSRNNSTSGRFRINVRRSDGGQVVLLSGLDGDQASFIAFTIAKYLGLPYSRSEFPHMPTIVSQWKRRRNG